MQLIIASSLVARRRKSGTVDVPDIRRVYSLFMDESNQYISFPRIRLSLIEWHAAQNAALNFAGHKRLHLYKRAVRHARRNER